MDYHGDHEWGKYGITWYEPETFNGVLFLLREANNANGKFTDPIAVQEGNRKWLKNVFLYKDKGSVENGFSKASVSRYASRYSEMLKALHFDEIQLRHIAYVNLNPNGGGNQKGKDYATALSDLKSRLRQIYGIIPQEKVRYIITCRDIFQKMMNDYGFEEGPGFVYGNGATSRSGHRNGEPIIFEMVKHPCVSPAITGIHQ